MQTIREAGAGDIDQLHGAEHGRIDRRVLGGHPPLELAAEQRAVEPERQLELDVLRDLAPLRARDRGRAADRPPACCCAERLGQQSEHVLDRSLRLSTQSSIR